MKNFLQTVSPLDLFILKMLIHEICGEINEIKVCSCHFDLVFYAIKKISTTDEIEVLICSVSGKIKPYFFSFDGVYIVCCVRFIIWAANNHDGNLGEIVSEECNDIDIIEDLKPVNCIDQLKVYKNEFIFVLVVGVISLLF